jgi:hypothetical protein
MQLKTVLPELAQKMAEDLSQAGFNVHVQYVLMDYLQILHLVNEIYHLPDEIYYLIAEEETVKAIRAFLEGHETREGLKNTLLTILLTFLTSKKDL